MYPEKLILKKSPALEFLFMDDSFQIIDAANPDNEGVFSYKKLVPMHYKNEKVN